MKKNLIVTCHDFSISHSVNEGVRYALNQNNSIISQLALLANAPGAEHAVEIYKEFEHFPLGLNVTFTTHSPIISTHKTLTDENGDFIKPDLENWDFSMIDKFDEKEIREEIDAQFDWFVEKIGKKPNVLLTPKSEHGDPKILIPLSEKAKEENIPIRTPAWKWYSNYGAQDYVKDLGVVTNDMVRPGLKDWKGRFGYDLERDLEKLIEEMKEVDGVGELLIFCGFFDEELLETSSVSWQRGQYIHLLEYKPEVLQRIENEFEIISYSDL